MHILLKSQHSTVARIAILATLPFAISACSSADSDDSEETDTGIVDRSDIGRGGSTDTGTTTRTDTGTTLPDTGTPDSGSEDATIADGGDDAGNDASVQDAGTGSDASGEAICGDGVLQEGEECDDGDTVGGDGCSYRCEREVPFVCRPCSSDAECGGDGDLCIDGQCAADCSVWPCVDGQTCAPGTGTDASGDQCLPVDGCATENCSNATDDDGDGDIDCDDSDCETSSICTTPTGEGTCDEPIDARVGVNTGTPGFNAQSPSCLSIDEEEAVFQFTPTASGTYCLDTRGSSASDTVVSVRTECGNLETETECVDDIDGFQAYRDFTATGTDTVYILVDTYSYDRGDTVTLNISEGACGGGGGTDPGDTTDRGEIDCFTGADDVDSVSGPGASFQVTCPSGCASAEFLYGTDIYTDDSWICAAAIHAGVITDEGGEVQVNLLAGQDSYTGSTRNGVTSDDWILSTDRSYSVESP